MARPNPEKKYHKTPTWQYIAIGFLIVIVIVALYYGFFVGQVEEIENQEDPANLQQRISENGSFQKESVAVNFFHPIPFTKKG